MRDDGTVRGGGRGGWWGGWEGGWEGDWEEWGGPTGLLVSFRFRRFFRFRSCLLFPGRSLFFLIRLKLANSARMAVTIRSLCGGGGGKVLRGLPLYISSEYTCQMPLLMASVCLSDSAQSASGPGGTETMAWSRGERSAGVPRDSDANFLAWRIMAQS